MLYLETQPDTFAPWRGERISGNAYPLNIEHKWSGDDLASIGLHRPATAQPVPPDKIITSTDVKRIEGLVRYVHVLEDRAPPAPDQVDDERDRRINAGFTFDGVEYQSGPEDRENIQGAYSSALTAILVDDAQPGDLRWADPDTDFAWIAADNSMVTMDAHQVLAFGIAAKEHKQRHIFAARALKDMDPIPSDFATHEAYWP